MKKKLLKIFGMIFLCGVVFGGIVQVVLSARKNEQIICSEEVTQNPYWPQVEGLLESFLTDETYVEVEVRSSWSWDGGDRETEHPVKYVFDAQMYENDFSYDNYPSVIDRYLVVLDHCTEEDGHFEFFIWVEEDGDTDVIKTDFKQQLFSYILAKTSYERALEQQNGFLIGISPSESGYAIPYYELMEEPLTLETVVVETAGEKDSGEIVFQTAYEKMHAWQEQVQADLTLALRFCDGFHPEDTARYMDPGKPQESMDPAEFTDWVALMEVQGYWYWLDMYGSYFPEHELSFYEDYGEQQEAFYEMLLMERETYLAQQEDLGETEMAAEDSTDAEQENLGETEMAAENSTDTAQDDSAQEEMTAEINTYTVQKGDTLWQIALQYYGDGRRCLEIWKENREVIGEDMNYILPGQVLHLPDMS